MKQDIEIIRGTTNTFNIEVKDADGAAYALAGGEKLVFGVKANKSNTAYDIVKILTSENANPSSGYELELCPEDTANLPCGRYCYDIGLQSGTDYYNIIECSHFIIAHNITSKAVT